MCCLKLSSYRRIYDQDYQGPSQQLVSQLATPLNASFQELYDGFNNNITFSDNINCTLISFNVSVDATGKPLNTTQFKLANYQTNVSGLWVINTVNNQSPTVYAPGAVQCYFVKSNNNVIINNIKGLTPSLNYTVTVIAIS